MVSMALTNSHDLRYYGHRPNGVANRVKQQFTGLCFDSGNLQAQLIVPSDWFTSVQYGRRVKINRCDTNIRVGQREILSKRVAKLYHQISRDIREVYGPSLQPPALNIP